jgi:hypothetical protein
MIVVVIVKSNHGEMLLQVWDPATVDNRSGSWFRPAYGMHSMPWEGRKHCAWGGMERERWELCCYRIVVSVKVRRPHRAGTEWRGSSLPKCTS